MGYSYGLIEMTRNGEGFGKLNDTVVKRNGQDFGKLNDVHPVERKDWQMRRVRKLVNEKIRTTEHDFR